MTSFIAIVQATAVLTASVLALICLISAKRTQVEGAVGFGHPALRDRAKGRAVKIDTKAMGEPGGPGREAKHGCEGLAAEAYDTDPIPPNAKVRNLTEITV